jgi:hypothetical protein
MTMDTDQVHDGILCLRSGQEPEDWYAQQIHALGAVEWRPGDGLDGAPDVERLAGAIRVAAHGRPMHLVATGTMVTQALAVAARHPELVTSVLAGDPEVAEPNADYQAMLRRVRSPTLVVVAAPESDSDTSIAQTVAGEVENGVMVIVDRCLPPVHRNSSHSFNEWVTAFMIIAEGLWTLTPEPREEAHA